MPQPHWQTPNEGQGANKYIKIPKVYDVFQKEVSFVGEEILIFQGSWGSFEQVVEWWLTQLALPEVVTPKFNQNLLSELDEIKNYK